MISFDQKRCLKKFPTIKVSSKGGEKKLQVNRGE